MLPIVYTEKFEWKFQAVYGAVGTDVDSPPEVLTEKLFKEMDADGNGEISWEEFRDAAMKDDKVLKLLRPLDGS